MSENSFHFKMCDFECSIIKDGTFTIPKEKPQKSLSHDMPSELTLELACMLVSTGKHKVLIDTGCGAGVEPSAGKLIENLQADGIQCKDIDTVIISHCHPDHISGNIDTEGKPSFPNARYVVYKKEWEFWTSEHDPLQLDSEKQEFLAVVSKKLLPLKDQITLVDGEQEIVPGVKIIEAPGHTAGHIVLVISSGSEQLLHTCDLFHNPLELERPDIELPSDDMPEQASRTRIRILSRVVTPGILVFACHFPFPGIGHIVKKGDIWLWNTI